MESYIAAIEATDKLKPLSKAQYVGKLRSFVKAMGPNRGVNWILDNPGYAVEQLEELGLALRTRQAYVDAVMAVWKYGDVPEELKQRYDEWVVEAGVIQEEVRAIYESNKPSKRQREAHVPWEEVEAMRDALPSASDERLLLSMYTMIPPARADYGSLRIFKGEPRPAQVAANPNHLVVGDRGKVTLVLRQYKTSEAYGEHVKVLPTELAALVRRSIADRPREFLFTTTKTRTAYASNAAFAEWVGDTLRRLFDRPFTCNGLRHSFISSLDLNTMSVKAMKQTARDMMHSVATMTKYRLFFNEEASEPEDSE